MLFVCARSCALAQLRETDGVLVVCGAGLRARAHGIEGSGRSSDSAVSVASASLTFSSS